MSKIKNGGLDQYGAGPFEQQQFATAGVEGVNYFILSTFSFCLISSFRRALDRQANSECTCAVSWQLFNLHSCLRSREYQLDGHWRCWSAKLELHPRVNRRTGRETARMDWMTTRAKRGVRTAKESPLVNSSPAMRPIACSSVGAS